MNDNYYIVFTIDYYSKTGKDLAKHMDCQIEFDQANKKQYLRGFQTKAKMVAFVNENKGAFNSVSMLKPVS
jgi:hypothetical protein